MRPLHLVLVWLRTKRLYNHGQPLNRAPALSLSMPLNHAPPPPLPIPLNYAPALPLPMPLNLSPTLPMPLYPSLPLLIFSCTNFLNKKVKNSNPRIYGRYPCPAVPCGTLALPCSNLHECEAGQQP